MTVAEAAKTWGVHRSRVLVWIKEGRIQATRHETAHGPIWLIDDHTQKPEPKPPGRKRQ